MGAGYKVDMKIHFKNEYRNNASTKLNKIYRVILRSRKADKIIHLFLNLTPNCIVQISSGICNTIFGKKGSRTGQPTYGKSRPNFKIKTSFLVCKSNFK